MKKRTLLRAAAALIGGLLVSSCAGCSLFPREEQMLSPPLLQTPQITYDQVTVKKGTIENDATGTGNLVSVSQEDYSFQYSGGVLESIRVKAGDTVKKGEVLATLYTDNLDNQIEQQQLTVKQAQLAVDDANATLSDDTASSPANAKLLRNDKSAAENAQFNLEKQQLQLDQLNKQKARATIASTIGGQVVYVATAGAGANVSAFQTLVTVADPTQLEVRYDGGNLSSFSVGAAVNVTYSQTDYPGKVVSNVVTLSSGSASNSQSAQSKPYVLIKVPGLPPDATIGDSVTLRITLEKKDNVITLPSNYVHTGSGKYYVNMLDKNGIRIQQNVEIGIQSQTDTEIVKGLSEGDSVIQ